MQEIDKNQLDALSIYKLAEMIHQDNANGVENVEIERKDPKTLFEKSLQQHKVSVDLWESYLKFCVVYDEEAAGSVFERAIQACGQSTRSANIWLLWIDIETSFLNMAKCNLLCYLAIKTPLLDHELIMAK